MTITVSDIGEKRIISEFLTPLFNANHAQLGIGDDCGMLDLEGNTWLFSTDRVPADLIAFKLGILGYRGLGRYLAWLNISDIAACGGQPIALLLCLGLSSNLPYSFLQELCTGFKEEADRFLCRVIGGDISSSSELSISATSIGKVSIGRALTRRGAKAGDKIFSSKPIGLTPAAFAYHLRLDKSAFELSCDEIVFLNNQFTQVLPMVDLGRRLSDSLLCNSCMDNTDGLGNTLDEIATASGKMFVIQSNKIHLPPIVRKIAHAVKEDPLVTGFGAGADLSLVGTISGAVSDTEIKDTFGETLQIIGYVTEGKGVFLEENDGSSRPLEFSKWNYFSKDMRMEVRNCG